MKILMSVHVVLLSLDSITFFHSKGRGQQQFGDIYMTANVSLGVYTYLHKEHLLVIGKYTQVVPFILGNPSMGLINLLDFYSLIIKPN